MTSQQQDVLFFVFTSFFILIGVASLSVLLGFPKTADKRFRQWAVPGFFAGVTTAVFGLFRGLTSMAPIVVTLVLPAGMSPASPLKSGYYQYDEIASDKAKIVTRTGPVSPVPGEGGSWQVRLPVDVSSNPTKLHLEGEDGSWWVAGPFFPNYIKQEMRTGKPFVPVSDASWQPPGVALVSAAEPGRAPAVQQQAGIKFNNYARRIADRYERPYYEWRVFVDEPPAVLDTITQVDYVLHPTFAEPFQTSRDRNRQFELPGSGWGEFTILVTVHYTNGKEAKTGYPLNLGRRWPVETHKATDSSLRVTLEKILVEWDGSLGPTGWAFDILLDGKPLLRLPNKNYDDSRQRTKRDNEYVPEANRRVVGAARITGGRVVRIEVRGKRSFGGDIATGTADLGANGGPLTVKVTNSRNPRNGSFVFHFAATPI